MDFGIDKCTYIKVVKGNQVNNLQPLEMNDIFIQPIEEENTYKYLGQDENINFDGLIYKERVTKEYFTRVRKILTSELSAYNKIIANNSFALPAPLEYLLQHARYQRSRYQNKKAIINVR